MTQQPIPVFFQMRILLAFGLGVLIPALSLTLYLALNNGSVMLPGMVLGLFLIGRGSSLLVLARRGHYREVEAICSKIEVKGYRRQIRLVTFETKDHITFAIPLENGKDLKVGEQYLLYFHTKSSTQPETHLSDTFIDLCKTSE